MRSSNNWGNYRRGVLRNWLNSLTWALVVTWVVEEQRTLRRVSPVALLLTQVAEGVVPFGLSVTYMLTTGWSAVLVIGFLPVSFVIDCRGVFRSIVREEHWVAVGDFRDDVQ